MADYIETVENDAGDVFDVFHVAVPRATTVVFVPLDLTNPTALTPTLARAVAVPVAAETQRAVAAGALVLP